MLVRSSERAERALDDGVGLLGLSIRLRVE